MGLLRALYGALYRAWPDASRRALSRTVTLSAIQRIVELHLAESRCFEFSGSRLDYHFHSYNNFRLTERAVEIPIVAHELERLSPTRVLEIGNVAHYYYDRFRELQCLADRVVVDRFERSFGVVNCDIADYSTSTPFDFAFSISTFEHMDSNRGWNRHYVPGGASRCSYAADNIDHVLTNLLSPNGAFLVTAPLGYSEDWDQTFYSGELERLPCSSYSRWLYRRRREKSWELVDPESGREALRYAGDFPRMHFVVILRFEK